jgi:hypothetical protein
MLITVGQKLLEGKYAEAAALGLFGRRGLIWNLELGIMIPFQYAPESITEEKTLDWQTMPVLGLAQPLLAYGSGDLRILRFRILLDAHASPHPLGNVESELRAIRTLTVPFDVNKKPTVDVPKNPLGLFPFAPKGPGRVSGIPPVVKIFVGGKIYKGVVRSVNIEEVLHGTTPMARLNMACTRAWVDFEFIVIEDSRMLVQWAPHHPVAPMP